MRSDLTVSQTNIPGATNKGIVPHLLLSQFSYLAVEKKNYFVQEFSPHWHPSVQMGEVSQGYHLGGYGV